MTISTTAAPRGRRRPPDPPPDRAAIELAGNELLACAVHGLVEIDEPQRLPLPWHESVALACNELRDAGEPLDGVSILERLAADGAPPDRQLAFLNWLQVPATLLVKYYGPDGGWDPVRLRDAVYRWSAGARDALLVEAAAAKLRRGQFPADEIARLKGNPQ